MILAERWRVLVLYLNRLCEGRFLYFAVQMGPVRSKKRNKKKCLFVLNDSALARLEYKLKTRLGGTLLISRGE